MVFDSAAFGHRVRAARVWQGLAPKELASRLGRSDEAIYRIERGEHSSEPDKLLLQALARELGQTEVWLLAGDAPPWASVASPGSSDLLERARLMAVQLADDVEALAQLLAAEQEASG